MPENAPIIVPNLLRERFAFAYKHNRVILSYTPCGSGKTVVAKELLKQYKTCYLSAADDGFSLAQVNSGCKVLILDDLHLLYSSTEKAALCELIRNQKNKHFILLSWGTISGWLMPFQFSGIMEAFEMNDLMLNKSSIQKLACAYGISLTHTEIGAIVRDTKGYPVALAILVRLLSESGRYNEAALNYPLFLRRLKMEKTLTAAEQQVLKLLYHNLSNQQICDTLGISLSTAKAHVGQIMKKLGVSRRSEEEQAAERLGLI